MLSTTLLSLARVVHILVVLLASLVPSQAGNSTANGTLDAVSNAGGIVVQLALGLLLLSFEVLLATLLLKVLQCVSEVSNGAVNNDPISSYLRADEATNSLLSGADSLVPRTAGTVGIVLGHARGSSSEAGNLRSGVRSIVLNISLVLLSLALVLVGGAASEGANQVLGGAGGRVHIGLEGRGVVVVGGHVGLFGWMEVIGRSGLFVG